MNDADITRWLENGLLLAYLDGAVDAETQAQIEAALVRSSALRQELGQLTHLQTALDARLHRADVPSPAALGEYVLGLLSAEEAAVIEQRLAAHPHAAQEAAALAAYLADLDLPQPAATPETAGVPDWRERLHTQVTTLVAQLVDGLSGAPALGLAGVRGDEAAHQVYEAGDVQVIVEIQESLGQADRRDILGLVTGPPAPLTYHADLYRQDQLVATTAVDRLGNFVLAAVAPGEYGLVLHTTTLEIAIPILRVE